jgi:hypothetical protein
MAGAQFQSKSRGFILKTFECRRRRMHYMRRPRYGKGRLLGLISETGVFFLLINPLPRANVYATYLAPFTKLNVHGSKIQKNCQGKACCKKGRSYKEAYC